LKRAALALAAAAVCAALLAAWRRADFLPEWLAATGGLCG
jgi:hypothetical protein